MLVLTFARENGKTCEQLDQNTAKTPHVNSRSIANSENDLGSSIKSALNISIDLPIFKAPTSHIDHPDATFPFLLEQDILRLQVAVYNAIFFEETQGLQDLDRESPNQVVRETCELMLLQKFIQVFVKYLKRNATMASKNEGAFHSHNIASEFRIFQKGCLEDGNLYFGLLLKLFLAFNQLQCDILLFLMVKGLEHTAERSSAKLQYYFISISYAVMYHNFWISFTVCKIAL